MKKITSMVSVFLLLTGFAAGIGAVYASDAAGPPQPSHAEEGAAGSVSSAASGTSAAGPRSALNVGAAKVKIEIPENFFPYTAWGPRYLTGVRDDLYVRAIMMANKGTKALFVSVETGDLSDEWIAPMARLSGVPECNIQLSASHTHSAPFISKSLPQQGLKDVEKSGAFAQNAYAAVIEAIERARADMRPAKVGYGTGTCDINVNRDHENTGDSGEVTSPYYTAPNPHGICDKTVGVMKFTDMAGKPIAYVINYSIHPVVMFMSYTREGGMEMTGDIAGVTARYVEEGGGEGCVALWTMACAADTMPRHVSNCYVFDARGNFTSVDAGPAGWALLDQQARELGGEVLRVGAAMTDLAPEVALSGTQKNITVPGKAAFHENPLTVPRDYQYEDGPPIELRLGLIMIDGVALVGIPAEVPNTVGLRIKAALKELGCENSLCVTQCNGSVSYTSDDFGYENRTFSAIASSCKQGVDGKIMEAVKSMYGVLAR